MQSRTVSRCTLTIVAFATSGFLVPSAEAQIGCAQFEDQKLLASDAAPRDEFGSAVALSGERIIIGAPNDDDQGAESGAAYVFRLDVTPSGEIWSQEAKLLASGGTAGDTFGSSVAISLDWAVVGAPTTASGGTAYVFRRIDNGTPSDPTDDGWIEVTHLVPESPSLNDRYGGEVVMNGERILIAATGSTDGTADPGPVFVFRLDDGQTPSDPLDDSWYEEARIVPSDVTLGDRQAFGRSMALQGDRFAVSSVVGVTAEPGSGAAYVFRLEQNGTSSDPSDDTWVEEVKLTPSDSDSLHAFGWGLTLHGNLLAARAFVYPYSPPYNEAYVFQRLDSGTPNDPSDDLWMELDKLPTPDTPRGWPLGLGQSMAIRDDSLLVGAPLADEACPRELNCNSGSAYMFERNDFATPSDPTDDAFVLSHKIVASDRAGGNLFGQAAAISSTHFVICSPKDGGGSCHVYRLGAPVTGCFDDGLYCNGDESCVGGQCVSSFVNPCNPGEFCCESSDTCGVTDTCRFIGFEPEEGYVPGRIDGQPAVPGSSMVWGVGPNGSLTEGHVDTAFALTGSQHLRLGMDPNLVAFPFQPTVDARFPADAQVKTGVIAPTTVSLRIRTGTYTQGVTLESPTQGQRVASMFFDAIAEAIWILEASSPGTYIGPFFPSNSDYDTVTIHIDPCDRFKCVGGLADGQLCDAASDCPGGRCAGRIDYSYVSTFWSTSHQGVLFGGTAVEQLIVFHFEAGTYDAAVDVDDVVWEVGEPCPVTCGNHDLEVGEDCETNDDSACPGRCVPPDEEGPNGQAPCTCVLPFAIACDAQPVGDDTVIETVGHGGWFRFTAQATAYAVEMCVWDHDSRLSLWTGSCEAPDFVALNDGCFGEEYSGELLVNPNADPLASCFEGPPSHYDPELMEPACMCMPTVIGQEYFIYDERAKGSPTNTINLRLTPRYECDKLGTTGACCDRFADTCLENVIGWECTGEQVVFFHDESCAECTPLLGACCDKWTGQCTSDVRAYDCDGEDLIFTGDRGCHEVECTPVTGACCDRLTAACTDDVSARLCVGANRVFTRQQTCAAAGCTLATGACCDRWTTVCTDDVVATACTEQNLVFTPDQTCAASTCTPAPGACCDITPVDGQCNDGVIFANCQGLNLTWYGDRPCSQVECNPDVIPAVSEWGYVILVLLLLAAAKISFRRSKQHA